MSEIFNAIMFFFFFNNKELLTILTVVTHWVNQKGTLEVISKHFFQLTHQYKIPLPSYKPQLLVLFFKDLTATVDSVLPKQTWPFYAL